MRPDVKVAIQFLETFRPAGPWVLTRIRTDRTSIDTGCFTALGDVEKWLIKWNGSEKDNIYFQVNSWCDGLQFQNIKKLSRAHIKSMDWLHIDIDPKPGADFDLERQKILAVLQNPPAGIQSPSIIVDSGGGYQGFWRLTDPFDIHGDEALYDEAALWNMQLENLLEGSDSCHNVDRIMRLPGTVNWPTEKKAKLGRKPAMATVIASTDESFSLSQFKKAVKVQMRQGSGGGTVKISGNIRRLENVQELGSGVPDSVKALIVQGPNSETHTGTLYESDSEAVWFVVCELVRQGIEDEVIYSVLTDPDFDISEHVLKQPNVDRYAKRQIERAKEMAVDPLLMEMNDKYALIKYVDGASRILLQVYDESSGRSEYRFQSHADFKNSLSKKWVTTGKDDIPAAQWWLRHPQGREYEGIVFMPEQEAPTGYLNMWEGFAYPPRQGNWQLLEEHIQDNVCSGEDDTYQYLLNWMARGVQMPWEQGHSGVVMRGREGVGKSFLAKMYGSLFGAHAISVSNGKHIVGQFNGHMINKVFLFGDEAFHVGDSEHAAVLKTLITEDKSIFERKDIDARLGSNRINLMLASNEKWVVPAGYNDRRFLVLDVGDAAMQDSQYFGRIARQMREGGYSAFLYDLMQRDISAFDVRKIPQTSALMDQKLHSLKPLESWFYNCLCDGSIIDGFDWEQFHPNETMLHLASGYYKKVNSKLLGHFLKDVGAIGHNAKRSMIVRDAQSGREVKRNAAPGRFFKPLDECRKLFEASRGVEVIPVEFQDVQEEDSEENPF